ncbi:transposase [Nocardia sp. NPDC052278]|uniref:transposase n=1 Tax=unclassified Nocardia TaxID=2637762 RepID=UPI0036AF4FC4
MSPGSLVLGSTWRNFTEENKARAVAFVLGQGRPVAEVAYSIGCHEMTLRKWVKRAKESGAEGGSGDKSLTDSERAESEGLRSEKAELKMQVAFAKKVANGFAKDQR